MQTTPAKVELRMASGASTNPDAVVAAEMACERLASGLSGAMDAAFVFFSPHHAERGDELAATVRKRLNVANLIGVSSVTPIGGAHEYEHVPSVSILAGQFPGVAFTAFTSDSVPLEDESEGDLARLAAAVGATEEHAATFLFADPFSVPLSRFLPALNKCRKDPGGVIFGGLASAAAKAGGNTLLLNDRVMRSGAVGLSLRGAVRVDAVVSQGCRPFGPNFVVTKAKGNVVFELSGKPALEAIHEAIMELGEEARVALGPGLFVGRVINEYKARFGRGDFLINNVVGVDQNRMAVAVAGPVRVGQTIRLHARDAVTAKEDLALLLDAQKLYDRPKGALLVSCTGRGKAMFGFKDHDAGAVQRAFAPFLPGEERARGGQSIDPQAAVLPLGGFFAAGEIGPVGNQSFLHGHTACVALFRDL